MAIIQCPKCNQRISSKAKVCNHCQYNLETATEGDKERAQKTQALKKKYSLQMQTFFSFLLFVAGIYLLYQFKGTEEKEWLMLGQGAIAVGAVLYLVNRIRVTLAKRQK